MASAEKRGKGKKPWRVRYKKPDGTWGSEPGFATRAAALKWGNDQESDIRHGRWRDPRGGQITLDAWFALWLPAQDYARRTRERLEGDYRNHLRQVWGGRAIGEIGVLEVAAFENRLGNGLGRNTIAGIMSLLRMLMEDAVADGRLTMSPVVAKRRRGRRKDVVGKAPRKAVALTTEAFMAIALRLPRLNSLGAMAAVMAVVTAFTGMRWGEVTAMQRRLLMLMPAEGDVPASGWYIIDDDEGSVHDPKRGPAYLGPPKGYIGRTIELPPFLVELLLAYMASLPPGREMLFVTNRGGMLRSRSAVSIAWRLACDGWPARESGYGRRARVAAAAVVKDLHWHDLRHTHKTWLVEDGVPAVARDERLGHRRGKRGGDADSGQQDHVYVHATAVMRKRILEGLQRRWESAAPESVLLRESISRFFPISTSSAASYQVADGAVAERGHGLGFSA